MRILRGICLILPALLTAQTNEIVLHNFGYAAGGLYPNAQIVDTAGNLYGVTGNGGSNGSGLIFRVDPQGRETVLYNFTGGASGGWPSSLAVDGSGNLYGTAKSGGAANQGLIFKLDKSGHESVLYNFTGGADGGTPSGLIADAAGNLYGVTPNDLLGGVRATGVVFKLDVVGNFTVLHTFTGGADGSDAGSLLMDPYGNLYGVAASGGLLGCGTLFEIDKTGTLSVLYNFGGLSDGGSLLASGATPQEISTGLQPVAYNRLALSTSWIHLDT